MVHHTRLERTVIVIVLLAELWLLTGSFDRFFNHDSLFYLLHAPRSWSDFEKLLSGPDSSQQYRPLTFGAMSLALPFFGLNPGPYHWIPILFHLVNTCLFFLLARRLMPDSLSVVAATLFWGLHSAAARVTYDIGYFPDFLMGFFCLASLIVAVDGFRMRSKLRMSFALLLYASALLCKEASVALPLALWICLLLSEMKESSTTDWRAVRVMVKKTAPVTGIYLGLALLHSIRLLSWLESGRLYAQGAGEAYNIGALSNLSGKLHYLYWALNLPDHLRVPHPNRSRAIVLILMGFLLIVWLMDFVRRRAKFSPLELGGLIWLIGMLAPPLLLSSRTEEWYLYLPVMGLALALGSLAGRLEEILARYAVRWSEPAILTLFLIPVVVSSAIQTRSFLNSSDSAYASLVVRNCLRDFKELYPTLPPRITLYLLPTFEKDVAAFFGSGGLYQLFYPQSRITMLFADKGDRLPASFGERADFRILQYLFGHVYDVTTYYRERFEHNGSVRLVTDLSKLNVAMDRSEFYPSYDTFATPNGMAVFFATPEKEIFTQIAGSTVSVPMGSIPAGARLRFDVSWMNDQGDGAWAELSVRQGGQEQRLFRRYMNPNTAGRGLTWQAMDLDLSQYAGRDAELILSCRNIPGHDTVADWLNWRDLRLGVTLPIEPDGQKPLSKP